MCCHGSHFAQYEFGPGSRSPGCKHYCHVNIFVVFSGIWQKCRKCFATRHDWQILQVTPHDQRIVTCQPRTRKLYKTEKTVSVAGKHAWLSVLVECIQSVLLLISLAINHSFHRRKIHWCSSVRVFVKVRISRVVFALINILMGLLDSSAFNWHQLTKSGQA